jgi:hypothetical protein
LLLFGLVVDRNDKQAKRQANQHAFVPDLSHPD